MNKQMLRLIFLFLSPIPCVHVCVACHLVTSFYSTAGINESYQMGLFQVLAAILHLGNVEVKDRDSDSSVIPVRRHVSHLHTSPNPYPKPYPNPNPKLPLTASASNRDRKSTRLNSSH